MTRSVWFSILALAALTVVWAFMFVVPALRGPGSSVLLLVQTAAPGPGISDWAQNSARFAHDPARVTAPLLPRAALADLARAGYRLGGDAVGETLDDAFDWLDLRAHDKAPFFLVLALPDGPDAADTRFERLHAHLERTGLARRTILAVRADGLFALAAPAARHRMTAPAGRPSADDDVMPTLLDLIGVTPSLPLGGRPLTR